MIAPKSICLSDHVEGVSNLVSKAVAHYDVVLRSSHGGYFGRMTEYPRMSMLLLRQTSCDSSGPKKDMIKVSKPAHNILPFTLSQKAIEALQRLRDTYGSPSLYEPITCADQAVLMAVETTLNKAKTPRAS